MGFIDKYRLNSVTMAKFIIAYANDGHFTINMTKLQKLLYICYGLYIAVLGERLTNEHPQAWPYGPVFPTTRNKLLHADWDSITLENVDDKEKLDPTIKSLLDLVFRTYGGNTASELTAWSHSPNSPWDRAVNMQGFKWGDQIPDEYIQPYFKDMLKPKSDEKQE